MRKKKHFNRKPHAKPDSRWFLSYFWGRLYWRQQMYWVCMLNFPRPVTFKLFMPLFQKFLYKEIIFFYAVL